MVDRAIAPGVAVAAPSAPARLGEDPLTDASIAAYLGAGERMQSLMDLTWKSCAVLLVLIAVAWALGLLPIAVRLF
jgi:hypothetical protein